MNTRNALTLWSCLLLSGALAAPATAYDYYANSQNGDHIPDCNKPHPEDPADQSCWAAANLLAAAGWGINAPAQDAQSRADYIYGMLKQDMGMAPNNAAKAMTHWLNVYGTMQGMLDYDANNGYVNVNVTNGLMGVGAYNGLLQGLGATPPVYATVLWQVAGQQPLSDSGWRQFGESPGSSGK